MSTKRILIVYYSQGGHTEEAAQCVVDGVCAVDGVDPLVKRAHEATPADLLGADGVCFGSPDYFGYMAGMLKDFFDRVFYPTRGEIDGKPCGLFVTHGGGGKAADSLESMCQMLNLSQVGKTVLVKDAPGQGGRQGLRDLGKAVAKAVR